MGSLNDLMALARKDGAAVALYRQPLRPSGQDSFYDNSSFEGYFASLQKRCAQEHIYYTDLINLVEAKYWGYADGGLPDFFHFQARGHELLGHAIDQFIGLSLRDAGYAVQ